MVFKAVAKMGAPKKKKFHETKVELPAKEKPMTVFDVVLENMKTRGIVRNFRPASVPDDILKSLIEAARHAASSENYQPWEFVIVRDQRMKEDVAVACEEDQDCVLKAPVLIIPCLNLKSARAKKGDKGEIYGVQDVAAATENLLLAANAVGLGTNWIEKINGGKMSILLKAPDWILPLYVVCIGWPAEEPKITDRHDFDEIVHFDQFGRTPRSLHAWGHGH